MKMRKARKSKAAPHSLAVLIDKILTETVQITENGRKLRITKLEAIIRMLLTKEVKGSDHAARTRLKYQQYAARGAKRQAQIVFVDSSYTQAMATQQPRKATNGR